MFIHSLHTLQKLFAGLLKRAGSPCIPLSFWTASETVTIERKKTFASEKYRAGIVNIYQLLLTFYILSSLHLALQAAQLFLWKKGLYVHPTNMLITSASRLLSLYFCCTHNHTYGAKIKMKLNQNLVMIMPCH